MKKFWIWAAAIFVLYMVFKEDKPKPSTTHTTQSTYYPTYTYVPPPVRTFHGYLCTDDCSGHEAGYNWAMINDVDDEYDCTGYSQSFIEGCIAYVEENY